MDGLNKFKDKKIHFIGIGGISMSAIANFLLDYDINVTGSDLSYNDKIKELESRGALINIEHDAENVKSVDIIVISSAIPDENPELKYARDNNIKVFKRAEMLAEIAKDKRLIAVSGSHGKTTTTGMLASIFLQSDKDPSIMIGGDIDLIAGNYKSGEGEFFITEADESDGSLLYFDPDISIVTNIEPEHLDYYGGEEDLYDTMYEFIKKTGESGIILCLEDEGLNTNLIKSRLNKDGALEFTGYGLTNGDYRADIIKNNNFFTSYNLFYQGEFIDKIEMQLTGEHNVLNSLAAIAAARKAGLDWNDIIAGLFNFKGVKRRFEFKGEFNGIKFIDDYAHHPSELETVIKSAKNLKSNQIRFVFQPHRYTRTRDLWDDFIEVLSDRGISYYIVDIYSANQPKIENISSKKLVDEIKSKEPNVDIEYVGSLDEAMNNLIKIIDKGDLVLTVGAGDVYKIGDRILNTLRCEQDV